MQVLLTPHVTARTTTCGICFQTVSGKSVQLPCKHEFHTVCWNKHLAQSDSCTECPQCNSVVTVEDAQIMQPMVMCLQPEMFQGKFLLREVEMAFKIIFLWIHMYFDGSKPFRISDCTFDISPDLIAWLFPYLHVRGDLLKWGILKCLSSSDCTHANKSALKTYAPLEFALIELGHAACVALNQSEWKLRSTDITLKSVIIDTERDPALSQQQLDKLKLCKCRIVSTSISQREIQLSPL